MHHVIRNKICMMSVSLIVGNSSRANRAREHQLMQSFCARRTRKPLSRQKTLFRN